jgi:hypothetical protein
VSARKIARQSAVHYSEMVERLERKRKLDTMLDGLQKQKHLMGKGKKTKQVVTDKFGDVIEAKTVYKWKLERKK